MAGILRLSEASSLAMHAMACLAGRTDDVVSTKEMATVLNCSGHHLSKIMQRLNKAGLLRSVRGPSGGFRIARNPADVTLLDVYEAIEGELISSDCLLSKKICAGNRCICGELLSETNRKLYRHLKGTRLLDLADVMPS